MFSIEDISSYHWKDIKTIYLANIGSLNIIRSQGHTVATFAIYILKSHILFNLLHSLQGTNSFDFGMNIYAKSSWCLYHGSSWWNT